MISETSSHKSVQSLMEFNTIADDINEIIEINERTNHDEVDNEAGLPGEVQEDNDGDEVIPDEIV